MDMHFCKGELKGVSFIGTPKNCHQQAAVPACHKTLKKGTPSHKGCCENEQLLIKKTDLEATSPQVSALDLLPITYVCTFVAVFFLPQHLEQKVTFYPFHKPPLPKRNIQAQLQTFLI